MKKVLFVLILFILASCTNNNETDLIRDSNVNDESPRVIEQMDFVEFIDISGQFDCENNYPEKEIPVNSRSTKTEKIGINGLHCIPEGYMQIGDAVFRNMVHFVSEK